MQGTDFRAQRWRPFGTTIFAEMTALARRHGAVNLSQGMPDEDGPGLIKEAAERALRELDNQYAPPTGVPALTAAIAASSRGRLGREIDPVGEVTVTPGCTGALAAVFLGLLNPGDEVVVFEPFYDAYRAGVAMAGARARYVPLRPVGGGGGRGGVGGRFTFDPDELEAAFGPRTRAVLVNTPHNPTGAVATREELGVIAGLCQRHGAVAISDEVYAGLIYEGEHVSIASLPGMAERTIVCDSLGKTFSLTGWKIGWTVAPPGLTAAVRAAQQFLIFAVSTPLQHAAAAALGDARAWAWVEGLRGRYAANRAYLSGELAGLGFVPLPGASGYFILADHRGVSGRLGLDGDVELCRAMVEVGGVAAIPPSAFYQTPGGGRELVRFAFCKKRSTLEAAVGRLRGWLGG